MFQDSTNDYTSTDPLELIKESSGWTPPPGKDEELDCYINTVERQIDSLPFNIPKPNISKELTQAMFDLINNQDIIIKPADKGGAVVVLNTEDYIKEGLRQLNDIEYYVRTTQDPTQIFQKEINQYIDFCTRIGVLPPHAPNILRRQHPRTPCIYFLPKIHKRNNPGRPIVSGCNGPTELISQYVDRILNPFVPSKTPSILYKSLRT